MLGYLKKLGKKITIILVFVCCIKQNAAKDSTFIFTRGTCKLPVFITSPDTLSKPVLMLIIAGSGPTDHNGNSGFLKSNTYQQIADSNKLNGITTIRYDKRFSGDAECNSEYEKIVFDTFVDDVIELLKTVKKIFPSYKIFIAGHSEGSLVGIMAAQKFPISGFISLAGGGYTIDKILNKQIKEKASKTVQYYTQKILASLKRGKIYEDVPLELSTLFNTSIQPYLISWIKINPAKEIKKLNCKILILNGDADNQVSADNAKVLNTANKNSKLVILQNVTHSLKKINPNATDSNTKYSKVLAPEVGKLIAEFCEK